MKTIKIFFIVLSIMFLATSCEEYLEEVNKTQRTTDLVYNDAEAIRGLVAASYSYLRLWYGKENGCMLGESGTDIWIDARDNVGNLPVSRYLNLTADGTDFPIDQVWEYLWNAVNVVNTAEDYVLNSGFFDEDEQNQLLSELRFLRAFYYWHLVETWGPVPIKTTPTTEPSTVVERNSVDEVYAQMFDDVQFAIDNLTPSGTIDSRVSYWAAKALKARLALYYASDYYGHTEYYATAATEAQDIIDNGPRALADNYADVWDIENSTTASNPEFIWAVDYYTTIGPSDFGNALPLRLQGDGTWHGTIQRRVHSTSGQGNAQHLWCTPRWNFNSSDIGGPRTNDVLVRHYLSNPENIAYISPTTGNDTSSVEEFDVGTFYVKYGMGYVRLAPTRYLLQLFDETADQRYYETFRTAYYKHPQIAPTGWPGPECAYPDMSMFTDTDTALFYSNKPFTAAQRAWASTRYKAIDIDTLYNADGNYRDVGSEGTSDHVFPGLKKFEDTDPNQPELGTESSTQFNNYFSYRDFPIFRISEMYLIAAEALLSSDNGRALDLVNELRIARAIDGMEAEMTLSAVDLDVILEERAREFAGEDIRWFDLKRTNKLDEQIVYNPRAAENFQPKHYLRPIPSIQMQSVSNASDVAGQGFWQNEGY